MAGRYIKSNSAAYLRGEREITLKRRRNNKWAGGQLFRAAVDKALSHNVSNHEENNTKA